MPEHSEFLHALTSLLPAQSISLAEEVLAEYAVDQGPVLDLQLPLAVVWARTVEDVQDVVLLAARHGVSVVGRGAGTGVSGGAHASRNSLILSLERMNRILDINPEDEVAIVEPGW